MIEQIIHVDKIILCVGLHHSIGVDISNGLNVSYFVFQRQSIQFFAHFELLEPNNWRNPFHWSRKYVQQVVLYSYILLALTYSFSISSYNTYNSVAIGTRNKGHRET